jgi:hypothetical protein
MASEHDAAATEPTLTQVRQFCRETWGHDWYDVDDEVKDARKHVARALLSGAAPEEASHALAGDVQEARMQTASKAQQAAEAAAKREKAAAKREKAQLKADKEFGDGEVNLHLWADLIGKTWEWRKEARMLNSEWRTIELASDHRCVLREGVKREVKSEEVLYWHVCSNAKDFGSNAGSLALLGTPPPSDGDGLPKPFQHFSRKAFEKAYPSEVDASLH